MERTIRRENGKRWCDLEVTLKNGRLSICGSEGYIITPTTARKEALEYWKSFFEENETELGRMAIEYGKRTPLSAARFVLQSDGELHGLDVHRISCKRVYITSSCGQIVDSLREWFPEVIPYLPYHLNDMHAECEHQQTRGETWGTHPSAVCGECGYVLGSKWLKRELPAEVVAWVEGLAEVQADV